jgi:hypothetical protein
MIYKIELTVLILLTFLIVIGVMRENLPGANKPDELESAFYGLCTLLWLLDLALLAVTWVWS